MSRFKLSMLDNPQIQQSIYNDDAQSIDVSIANNMMPERYDEVEYEYLTSPYGQEVEYVTFYGNGSFDVSKILINENPLGEQQEDTFNFMGQTPAGLDGKYFILNDESGSVGVWFDVDNLTVAPVTGADRDIEINIATGDTDSDIASATGTALNLDAEFTVSYIAPFWINVKTTGSYVVPLPTIGTTSLTVAHIQAGETSINGKSIHNLIRPGDTIYIWFNVDGTAVDPAYVGETGIEVALLSTDSRTGVMVKTATAIDNYYLMNAEYNESEFSVEVTNKYIGYAGGMVDINSSLLIHTINQGKPSEIVSQVQVKYNPDWTFNKIIRLL